MRAAALAVLALAVFAEGRILLQKDDDPNQALSGIRPDTDTVFALGGDQTGLVQITGMLQNFPLDEAEDIYSINDLLDRPTTSYLDVTWSNWIDQRLEMLDLVQDMLAAPVRPRCPHMQPAASAMDNGMVSYLASSRFGPAILTTYAQQEDEGESDFDWDEVNIPEGNAIGRSYEDASLRDELSADADKAFKLAELESKLLSQESNLGYFGANKKPAKDQIMFNQLDGDYESVQPMILTHPNMLELVEQQQQQRAFRDESDPKGAPPVDPEVDPKQMALAILLFIGCCYVWTCLAVSCIRMRQQLKDKDAISGRADDLLIPLAPEGMKTKEGVEVASASVAPGDYYAPNGASFVRIAVPLMATEAPRSV